MDIIKRAKMVVCMEYIARAINNEDAFDGWLLEGVADGDIKDGSLDSGEVDSFYLENDNFRDLMDTFLIAMNEAYEDGGLYIDKVVTKRG